MHLLNETFEIPQAVLAVLYLVNDGYNPSLEGIVALSVGDGNDFLLVDLTIGLADLTIWRYQTFNSTGDGFLGSCSIVCGRYFREGLCRWHL